MTLLILGLYDDILILILVYDMTILIISSLYDITLVVLIWHDMMTGLTDIFQFLDASTYDGKTHLDL